MMRFLRKISLKKRNSRYTGRGGVISSKTRRNNLARSTRRAKNNEIKRQNRSSVFDFGHAPTKLKYKRNDETDENEIGKLVNQRTLKKMKRSERFVKKTDTVQLFLSPRIVNNDSNYEFTNTFKEILDKLDRDDFKTTVDEFVQEASDLYHFAVANPENEFCKNKIGTEYLFNSIGAECDALIILRRNHKILGFTTLTFKEESLYIELICMAENVFGGTRMMQYIIEIAKILNYKKVTLSSITDVYTKTFYEKFGFKYDQEHEDIDGLYPMTLILSPPSLPPSRPPYNLDRSQRHNLPHKNIFSRMISKKYNHYFPN
jgi:hypothetical protein